MTDEEYQKEKKKLLDQWHSQSKNKGLDIWKKVLKQYHISIEKAKKGFYLPGKGYVHLYFDEQQDKWLIREVNPSAN